MFVLPTAIFSLFKTRCTEGQCWTNGLPLRRSIQKTTCVHYAWMRSAAQQPCVFHYVCANFHSAKFMLRCRFGRSDAPAITIFAGSALKVGLFTSNKTTAPFAATTVPIKVEGALSRNPSLEAAARVILPLVCFSNRQMQPPCTQ